MIDLVGSKAILFVGAVAVASTACKTINDFSLMIWRVSSTALFCLWMFCLWRVMMVFMPCVIGCLHT
jgi:hypothetical protein